MTRARQQQNNQRDYMRDFNHQNLQFLNESTSPMYQTPAAGAANGGGGNNAAIQAVQSAFNKSTALAQATISEMQTDMNQLEGENALLTEQLETAKSGLSELQVNLKKISDELAELRKTTGEDIAKLTKDAERLNGDLVQTKGELAIANDKIAALEGEKTDLQSKLTAAEAKLSGDKANEEGAKALGLEDKSKSSEQGDNKAPVVHLSAAQLAEAAKKQTPGTPEARIAVLQAVYAKNEEFKAGQKVAGNGNTMRQWLAWRDEKPEGFDQTHAQLVTEALSASRSA